MKRKKIWILWMLSICIIITQTGCGTKEPITETEFYLDTFCTVTINGAREAKATEAIASAFDLCKKYENMLSQTRPGSDIARINESKGKPVRVSEETYYLIEKALEYAKLSNGRFDITIGAVSDLWDFKSENPKLPDQKALQAALKTVDYRKVHLREGNIVQLENPETQLNLGGLAKGYIADQLIEDLKEQGIGSAFVSLGGNVAVLGKNAEDKPWRIGIQRPYADRTEIIGAVDTTDSNLVTSGIYERKFVKNGKLYHHILDPETGYPAETELEEVTILGPPGTGVDCDAYSTICLMVGEEEGRRLLKKAGNLEAAFIETEDEVTNTDGMNLRLE